MAKINERMSGGANDAINVLRGNLMMRYPDAKVVCLVGERPYADKFELAYGLAKRFAAMGKRTLYVECAALERSISEGWKCANGSTLADYLAGKADAAAIIRRAEASLDAIPGGATAQLSEYISGDRLDALLSGLRGDYDIVVVDATAMGTEADAALVARRCDGALLLVEYCGSDREEAGRVRQELERDGVKLLGAVLVEPAKRLGGLTALLGKAFGGKKN